MNTDLLQAEAAVKFMTNLYNSKRASKEKLDRAIASLEAVKASMMVPDCQVQVSEINPDLHPVKEPIMKKQLELSLRADALRKKQAALSNSLHLIPKEQNCVDLVKQILEGGDEIEGIWTQKKNIDRNTSADQQDGAEKANRDVSRLGVIHSDLQRYREKKSKLQKKLENLGASVKKVAEWQLQLSQTELKINELVNERELI